MNRIWPYSCI